VARRLPTPPLRAAPISRLDTARFLNYILQDSPPSAPLLFACLYGSVNWHTVRTRQRRISMRSVSRKHRRLFAVGILLAFMAAWTLPAQACFGAAGDAMTQPACPHCPSPCCPGHCCAAMTAVCHASMLPAAPAQTPGKAVPAPGMLLAYALHYPLAKGAVAPPGPPPLYPLPASANIRFCSFQE